MDAFGIFEGGGVKGLAHVGALLAAEERQVHFVGVAGTSAGAIVAALIGVGYTANEMYDLNLTPRGALDKDFREFFGPGAWQNLQALVSHARDRYRKMKRWGKLQGLSAIWHVTWFRYHNAILLSRFFNDAGFLGTEHIVAWLEALLAAKVPSKSGANGEVVFKDVPKPLKIVATNMKDRRIKVFSQHTTPSYRVAEAVAASMTIPLLFKPQWLQGDTFLDGGLLSNFPAWLFDEERRQRGPLVPTFGFKLFGPPGTLTAEQPSIVRFLWGLGTTILAGDPLLETREVENLHVVPLRAHKHTIDFDLEPDDRDRLYEAGCTMRGPLLSCGSVRKTPPI
jgi:NTE family protein